MLQASALLTAQEIADVLGFYDDPPGDGNLTGAEIIKNMFANGEPFERAELKRIAEFAGMSVEELAQTDERFARYADPVQAARREIARRLLASGAAEQFAAEMCGLAENEIRRLKS